VVDSTVTLASAADLAAADGSALHGHLALAPLEAESPPLRIAARSDLLGTTARAQVALARK
jgi:hypothetical protein